ncbi:hypothetical protein BCR36DRAFT_360677 [Piromyces finnis]|uniref:Gamma-glutamylcyclotransferase AIG2-like domain-containing protein n=1 Tax=Piromyces finnis TaxID=1754191 RepID=A0A1Y1V0G1_9FUNG|nr:hypothetical protein BCR36DRAFT_360677 [Piromyces finnis]|eukprot:ORX43830.1 hypothetical protein BCR36DRAFT_360677 [Piromyces finnis]
MASQYAYNLTLKTQYHPFVEKDDTRNLLNYGTLNSTKYFVNYYYDNIYSKNFNVKNTAYYNQLTRSVNFLNKEINNNWTSDIHSLASINNLNISSLSNSIVQWNNYQNHLDLWNKDINGVNILSHLYGLLSKDSEFTYEQKYNNDNKETIKDLISLNNIKNEEIIENNLEKSFESNILVDCKNLKTKSNSHNSLHLVPSIKKQKIETEYEKVDEVEKEKQIDDDYALHPNYVFGYGSLINPDSRGCTVDSTKSARVIKVLAKGLERSWNYNCRDVYTAVGVAKVDDLSIACNGVIIPIDDPINDLPKLDERELHYRRVQLSRKNISIIHDDNNKDINDEDLLAPDAIIWVYEIVDVFIPTTDIPISQIYVDCILMGCMKEGGIEFAKQFIENTHGWNTSVWVNDRTSEHFRKNISRCIIKLTDEIVSSIDSLLTNNLSIDVNKRIIPAH